VTLDLVKYIVDEMTGPGDGDMSILIVGQRGSGKSDLALDIIDGVRDELADRLKKPQLEFFDPQKDIGVMLEENLLRVLASNVEDYHIKFLDDIGFSKGFNSRKHASKENDATTSLFGISRTKRGLLICTVQSHMFVDNKLRSLFKMYIEVNGPHDWEDSVNFSGIHKITLHPRDKSDPVHFPHPREFDKEDNHKIVYTILASGLACPEIRNVYRPMRKAVVDLVTNQKFGYLTEKEDSGDNEEDVPDQNKGDMLFDYLHDNLDLLEKRPNGKYYPSSYIVEEFLKDQGIQISETMVKTIAKKVRKETRKILP
jgi:hypothetical protein